MQNKEKNRSTNQLRGRWSIRYGGFILIGLGLLALYAMLPTVQLALEQRKWAVTICTIDSSKLLSDEYGTDTLELQYHYLINSTKHSGTIYETKINISRSEQFYRAILAELWPGAETECYYDPSNPDSVVIRRMTMADCGVIFVPLLFIFLGIIALILQYRR